MKKLIAGVDEVGRGSLIGPVYAAAVIFKSKINKRILKDSKKISKKKSSNIRKIYQTKFLLVNWESVINRNRKI